MTTEVKMTKADQERLKRLAAFAPIFRNPQFAFGQWHSPTGRGTGEDPLVMLWFGMSETAHQFIVVAHEIVETLKRKGFVWTKWIEQPEGQKLFSGNIDAIASANGEQLTKLAFALVREVAIYDRRP